MVDVRRGDQIEVLAPGARTETPTVETFRVTGGEAHGLIVVIDATADPAAASVVFTIQGVDPVSGKTWDILASAAVDDVETRVLRVHPLLETAANLIAADIIPPYFTVAAVHADTDSITYSVAAYLV